MGGWPSCLSCVSEHGCALVMYKLWLSFLFSLFLLLKIRVKTRISSWQRPLWSPEFRGGGETWTLIFKVNRVRVSERVCARCSVCVRVCVHMV